MLYDARNLDSQINTDGLLGALRYIQPTDIPNEHLRAAWLALGVVAAPILATFDTLARLLVAHPDAPGVAELLRRAKSEGGLTYLLVYYGFDTGFLGDRDIRAAVETIAEHASAFRVAEHHFRQTLHAAAEGQRRADRNAG